MSKIIGRAVVLSRGATPIAGVRTKSISIENEPIDFTDDDSAGWRELADQAGRKEVNISVSGLYTGGGLADLALSASDITDTFTLTYPGGRSISGTFNITSYSETGEHEGEYEFEAELQSNDSVTVTT